jgi:bifunctional N6-L-threonylcarbamoyladenine synthase / protein kinase Bud32
MVVSDEGGKKKVTGKERLVCLGIESTAHTFGVGIVDSDGKILADVRTMYKPEAGKGMVPREVSDFHQDNAVGLISEALKQAKIGIEEVGLVAFAKGPGLAPCLHVGASVARYLANVLSVPIVGVNHPVAHIEIGKLTTSAKDPVVLYLSGGNTQVIAFAEGRYRVFGETEDVPVGNAFDVIARELGLKSPGGPEIEKLAAGGRYIELPYVVKGMDLSFSGIISDAKRRIKAGVDPRDLCFSLQETCFAMLTEVAERAMAHTGKDEVLLVGGVAANKRMQSMLKVMCDERGAEMKVVDMKYAGDCGPMIAWTGILQFLSHGKDDMQKTGITQDWRVDDVEIPWMKKE